MSAPRTTRRAVAEINFGEGQAIRFTAGNRSIHQFWHLFSAQFRHVLLSPQRRPDSGRVAWTWREAMEDRPVTPAELAEVRRRLSEANRMLGGGFAGSDRDDDGPGGGGGALEKQVHAAVSEMVAELVAQRDFAFAKFICRTDAGLMVHSWGGAVAAEPYYPDTQNGDQRHFDRWSGASGGSERSTRECAGRERGANGIGCGWIVSFSECRARQLSGASRGPQRFFSGRPARDHGARVDHRTGIACDGIGIFCGDGSLAESDGGVASVVSTPNNSHALPARGCGVGQLCLAFDASERDGIGFRDQALDRLASGERAARWRREHECAG